VNQTNTAARLILCLLVMLPINAPAFDTREWPPEALEAYEIESLSIYKLVLKGKCATYALIMDPNGFVHYLRLHGHIGKNYGIAKEIGKEGIQIEEVISDNEDEWRLRTVFLRRRSDTQEER